jgi:hypothetical protein
MHTPGWTTSAPASDAKAPYWIRYKDSAPVIALLSPNGPLWFATILGDHRPAQSWSSLTAAGWLRSDERIEAPR